MAPPKASTSNGQHNTEVGTRGAWHHRHHHHCHQKPPQKRHQSSCQKVRSTVCVWATHTHTGLVNSIKMYGRWWWTDGHITLTNGNPPAAATSGGWNPGHTTDSNSHTQHIQDRVHHSQEPKLSSLHSHYQRQGHTHTNLQLVTQEAPRQPFALGPCMKCARPSGHTSCFVSS